MLVTNLLNISLQDWAKAEAYFKRNPDHSVMKKGVDNVSYSFFQNPKDHLIFAKGTLLGKGGFGKVKVAQNKQGVNFARKTIVRNNPGDQARIDNEVSILGNVGMLVTSNSYMSKTKPYKYGICNIKQSIVMEFAGEENLAELLISNSLNSDERKSVAGQIAQQLKRIHAKGIIHADIKPLNVRISGRGRNIKAKLVDFGISLRLPTNQTYIIPAEVYGTHGYMSPEILSQGRYSFASDIFALGELFNKLGIASNICDKMKSANYASRPSLEQVILEVPTPLSAAEYIDRAWAEFQAQKDINQQIDMVKRAAVAREARLRAANHTPTIVVGKVNSLASTPTAAESLSKIKDLKENAWPISTNDFFRKNMSYFLSIGKCYLPDILIAAIIAKNEKFVEFFIKETESLTFSERAQLIKNFSHNSSSGGRGPIEYAGSQGAIVIQNKLMKAYIFETQEAFGRGLAPARLSSSSSVASPAVVSYTPCFNRKASPTYQESKELIENLRNGYPALASCAFNDNKAYYLGIGQCYLQDILKAAIDGDQVDFIAFLVRETAAFSEKDLEKLYENFAKLDGVDGKSPREYAMSKIKFVASNCLLQAEFAKDRANFRY